MPTEPRLAAVRSSGAVYSSLEHWRGFAALWVMLFHAIGTQEKPLHPLVEILKIPARPGWLGVHLFFVISGYCIAANILSLRNKGLHAADFLRDRLCRILPTYWAALAMTLLLAFAAGRFNHAAVADNYPAGGRAWLGNLLLIQPYLGTNYYVVVYWTLVVELGFYFVATLLFTAIRVSDGVAAALMLMLTFGVVWVPPWSAWLVPACWPEFACGILVFHAILANHRQASMRRNVCLSMIIVLGVLGVVASHGTEPTIHSPKQLPFGAGFALLLYALYPCDDALNRAPFLRWLSFCGTFSFSLYLIHAPVGVRVYGIGSRFFSEQSPFIRFACRGMLLDFARCLIRILSGVRNAIREVAAPFQSPANIGGG